MLKHRRPASRRWAPLLALSVVLVTSSTRAMPARPRPEHTPSISCNSDDQCGRGTYCDLDHNRCVQVRRHVNVLYMFYLSRDRTFAEALGLYWHQTGQRGYRVVFPLYWSFWSPDHRTRMVIPLYLDHQRRDERHLVIPPVQYHRTPGSTRLRVWPLFFHAREGTSSRSVALWPFFYHAREGASTNTVLPPLLSFARSDPETETSEGLIGGLYYWHTRRRVRQRALVPLVYSESSPGRRFVWLAPLNLYWSRRDSSTLLAFPLLLHHHDRQSTTTMSLLPFYHHSSRGRRQLYIPPLLVYHRTGESRLLTVGPGYTYRNPDTIGLGIAPLLFVGWSEQRSHHVLFPLLWHLRSPDRRTVVIGSAYYHRRGSRLGVGLAPLVFYRRTPSSRSLNLLPLFSYGSYRDGRQRHLATPLFFVEGNTSHQRSQWGLMVPPFYRLRTPRLEVDLQVPLFLRWHDVARPSTTWILGGALWWHRSPSVRSHGLFPLYWHVRGPDRSFTLAGPYAHHSRPGHVGHSLWPLLHYHRTATPDGSRTTVAVLPAVFYRSGPSGSSLLSVLFGYHHGDGFQTWYAGPYVNHRRGQRRTDVLFPLLWSHRRPERSTVVVFPLLWHDRQRHRTCTVLFPLLWHFRRPTHRATVLFPVYWDFARGDRRTTVALNTLFIREKSKRTYDFHFLPLVRVQRKRPTDIKLSLLAGLFGYERIGRNRYLKLLLIPIELDRE